MTDSERIAELESEVEFYKSICDNMSKNHKAELHRYHTWIFIAVITLVFVTSCVLD